MINVLLPKPHPKPIVVEVFISRLFEGKGRIVASCVAHPGNHHLPKGWVDVEKERSGEDFFANISHTPKDIQCFSNFILRSLSYISDDILKVSVTKAYLLIYQPAILPKWVSSQQTQAGWST